MGRQSIERRQWGIWTLLILLMVGPMLVLSVAVSSSAWVESRDATMAETKILFGQINGRIADHIADFFGQALAINEMNIAAFQIGEVSMTSPGAIEKQLIVTMRAHADISSTYIGSLSGGLVDAGREGAGGREYVIETPGFAAGPFVKSAINAQGSKGKVLQMVPSFDARTRPWFRSAIEAGRPVWIEPFALFSGQDSAISTARPILDAQGRIIGVASVDIFLSQISGFLGHVNGKLGGTSFLIDDTGHLVASPSDSRIFDSAIPGHPPERIKATSSSEPLIAAAAAAIARDGEELGYGSARFYSFYRGKERLAALVSPLAVSGDLHWRIVSAFPEKAFMAPVTTAARNSILLICLSTILLCIVAMFVSGLLANRFRQFSEAFSSVAAQKGSESPTGPMKMSSIREVRRAQLDFNSMRVDLMSSFARLEGEIEERKRIEADLSTSQRAYDRLARTIPVGIYLVRSGKDKKLRYDYVSPRFRAITGFGPDEPLSGPEAFVARLSGPDLESFVLAQRSAVANAGNLFWEGKLFVKDERRFIRLESVSETLEDGDTLWHGVLSDITASHLAEEQIRKLLGERELLLREVHHRLKNNMNTAISILNLQAYSEGDSRVVEALNSATGRLESMSVLYDVLYRSDEFTSVAVKNYLSHLINEIHENFPNKDTVEIALEVADFRLVSAKMIPLGMIINELITNSMKHAFVGKSHGRISVAVSLEKESVVISVSDDGIGMPSVVASSGNKGFGMTLVDGLVTQLDGSLRQESEGGTKFIVSFDA